jgi:hypothetical protein
VLQIEEERVHHILTITVKDPENGTTGHMSMVVLAGSERITSNGNET